MTPRKFCISKQNWQSQSVSLGREKSCGGVGSQLGRVGEEFVEFVYPSSKRCWDVTTAFLCEEVDLVGSGHLESSHGKAFRRMPQRIAKFCEGVIVTDHDGGLKQSLPR